MMGLFSFFKSKGKNLNELARRLDLKVSDLEHLRPDYRHFTIPKRGGGHRQILAPADDLKRFQRRLLKRVLNRLRAHPTARGFERGQSIVTNALPHADKAVVVRMDLKDFFPSTGTDRILDYFKAIGWDQKTSDLLTRLCTKDGGLPQGAPTSPRLSNLVNFQLDVRLNAVARRRVADYTRYADDLTFSFVEDRPEDIHLLIRLVKSVLSQYGYRLHHGKKLNIRRRHDQQLVTGLTVNQGVRLPRKTRRWLRAVEHRTFLGQGATLDAKQLAGWTALRTMIEKQVQNH